MRVIPYVAAEIEVDEIEDLKELNSEHDSNTIYLVEEETEFFLYFRGDKFTPISEFHTPPIGGV